MGNPGLKRNLGNARVIAVMIAANQQATGNDERG